MLYSIAFCELLELSGYAGPLSETRTSGSPWVENVVRSFSMAAAAEADETICTSIHFE